MNPALEGYANAALADSDDVALVAEQLSAVDETVRGNGVLFAALTDTALTAAERRAVLGDLLESRVSERVRRIAQYTVQVVPAPDVSAALGWLAHRAREVEAGVVPAHDSLGHLEARRRVGGFAAQVFEGLTTAQLEEVEDQLFRFTRTVADTPSLRAALSDRDLPVEQRQGIVRQLLAGKVEQATLRLVDYVVVGGRPRDTVGTLDWLVEETARARGWRVARVHAARAIDDAERQRLTGSLTDLVGHPVELQVSMDAELLAGVVVEVGDLRINSTARSQLNALRDRIESGRLEHAANGSDGAPA